MPPSAQQSQTAATHPLDFVSLGKIVQIRERLLIAQAAGKRVYRFESGDPSFSVAPHVTPLPRSLRNVFAELADDLGVPLPSTGDLTPWTRAGVLLLNRVLTVTAGAPGSHRGRGWERVTDQAVTALAARGRPLVAVLWGKDAQAVRPLLGGVPVVDSVHPSPLSARGGFFGSRPFSRASRLLAEQGAEPVDWRLP